MASNSPDQVKDSEKAPASMEVSSPLSPRHSRWPIIIGVVAVLLGGFRTYRDVHAVFAPRDERSSTTATRPADRQLPTKTEPVAKLNKVVLAGLDAWLLAAGVSVLKRHRAARGLMLNWSITTLFVTGINMIAMLILLVQRMLEEHPLHASGFGLYVAALGCLTLIVLFLPVLVPSGFALIWFSRNKIRSEMADWH